MGLKQQLEFLARRRTQFVERGSHGGSRDGSGRKPSWNSGETKPIRLPMALHREVSRLARLLDDGLIAPGDIKPNHSDELAYLKREVARLTDELNRANEAKSAEPASRSERSHDFVTETSAGNERVISSVTESSLRPALELVVAKWMLSVGSRDTSPRWAKVSELLNELSQLLR
jgi:hypothetical protein